MTDLDAEAEDRVLVITRIFDAPRHLVWKAWTDPKLAVQWGGPEDYPAVHFEGDLRPGGKWRGILRSVATGEELGHGGVYRDVIQDKLLSFTFIWDRDHGQQDMLVTLTFEDAGPDRTKFTLRQERFTSVEERDGHNGGWNSAFDRLARFLPSVS